MTHSLMLKSTTNSVNQNPRYNLQHRHNLYRADNLPSFYLHFILSWLSYSINKEPLSGKIASQTQGRIGEERRPPAALLITAGQVCGGETRDSMHTHPNWSG